MLKSIPFHGSGIRHASRRSAFGSHPKVRAACRVDTFCALRLMRRFCLGIGRDSLLVDFLVRLRSTSSRREGPHDSPATNARGKRRACGHQESMSKSHRKPHVSFQLEHPGLDVLSLGVDRFHELQLLPLGGNHVSDEQISVEDHLHHNDYARQCFCEPCVPIDRVAAQEVYSHPGLEVRSSTPSIE